MAVWSVVNFRQLEGTYRIDAEYYQPHLLQAKMELERAPCPIVPLGELVVSGYRVVYENTEILDEPFDERRHVKFLPATDIGSSFPDMNVDGLSWISRAEWERYPHGRIKRGELLIEVKGKAEKVAIVPEDYPENVMVSGSLYKMTLNNRRVEPYYVLAYMLSKHGRGFRDRGKTNTLISYVNKDELYAIPVPLFDMAKQVQVADVCRMAYDKWEQSKSLYAEAEALLMHELRLDNWKTRQDSLNLSHQLTYERSINDLMETQRWDAQFFQPKYEALVHHLRQVSAVEQIGEWGKVLKGRSPGDYTESGAPVLRACDLTDIDAMSNWLCTPQGPHLFYVQSGDVCISSIGFGSIGKVQVYDKPEVCTTVSEVTVIRQQKINPCYLQVFLQSPIGQMQIEKYITGATGQLHLYPRDVEKIFVPILPDSVQKQFESMINASRRAKLDAKNLLETAKKRVEEMILAQG